MRSSPACLTVIEIRAFTPYVGETFDLLVVGGTFDASALTFSLVGAPNDLEFTSDFSNRIYALTVTQVPDPSALLLAAVGLPALLRRRRSIRRAIGRDRRRAPACRPLSQVHGPGAALACHDSSPADFTGKRQSAKPAGRRSS